MMRQVAVELARSRGRWPVLLALWAGVAVTAALTVGAVRDTLGLGPGGVPADVAAAGGARALTLVTLLAALAVAAGAATAGGDWSTGSLRSQLLVDPRRSRLWLAKCTAVAAGALLASVLLLAGFWTGLLVTASTRGVALPADAAADLAGLAARGVALVALAGAGACAVALAVRSTTAAVVLVLAAVLADHALLGLLPVAHVGQWGLRANVLAWLRDGTRVVEATRCPRGAAPSCHAGYLVALPQSAAVLGGLLALTLLVSWLTFRRRAVP